MDDPQKPVFEPVEWRKDQVERKNACRQDLPHVTEHSKPRIAMRPTIAGLANPAERRRWVGKNHHRHVHGRTTGLRLANDLVRRLLAAKDI